MLGKDDFTKDELVFNYLNLNKYLRELHTKGIHDINLMLLISLEKEYYEGENLKRIMLDLKRLCNSLVCEFDGEEVKFKVNKVSLDVGDILNRHNIMYRYNAEYMKKHGLEKEEDIPPPILEEFKARAYEAGRQQGRDWFRDHAVDAINGMFGDEDGDGAGGIKIPKDFGIGSGVTQISAGDDRFPPLEYICADYWLEHPRYELVAKGIEEVRNLPFSFLEKSYIHEAKYFLQRLVKRGEVDNFPDMFIKYSKDYLVEETIEKIIICQESHSNIEFYYYCSEPQFSKIFRSKDANKSKILQEQISSVLNGAEKQIRVALRDKI